MTRTVAGRVAAALLMVGVLAGCTDDQDPGLVPAGESPGTTSDTLGRCPPGGPDENTPPAGCLDAEGRLQPRP